MSQSQKNILAQRARSKGLKLTLLEMMEAPLGAEYRRTADDLRRDGWVIIVEQNRREPSKNLWKFIPPKTSPERITAVLSDFAEKRVSIQNCNGLPKKPYALDWRQANIACPVCGSWYEVKIDGKWVCSKKHEQEGVV